MQFTHIRFTLARFIFRQGYFRPGKATKLKVSMHILLIQHGVTVCLSYLYLLQTKLKETRRTKRPPHERNAKSSMLRYWCRRKLLLLIMLSIITLINPPRDRICWMRPNSDDWFILADSTFNREQWYENFRVTRDTFTIILNEIEHDIAKQDTPMRKGDPTRKKLAMTLYYFASTAEFRTTANLFGVSRAFLCTL